MRAFHLAVTAIVVVAGTTIATAQDRVAHWPSTTGPTAVNTSQAQAAMDRAAASRKYAFLFFWKERNSQTDKAWSVFQPAAAKLADGVDVISIQITDPAEKRIVDKYGATRAPMPLVLAVAPCGAITKAFTKSFDENQLRTAFVSPCTQRCLKALQNRKLVFVCVVERTDSKAPLTIPMGVQNFKADKNYGPATEIVLVDSQDGNEATFLKELGVGALASKPIIAFLAPPGVLIGQFGGAASKDVLVAKLVAAQSNPCAGGKCGPGGCCPKK